MTNFKDNVLQQIKNGELDMRPRRYFVLRGVLAACGVLITALIGVYVVSFIVFFLRETGVGVAPLYGFRGISIFVLSSPWLLLGAAAMFLAVLYVLVSRYAFSYQRPLIYTLIATIAGVIVLAALIGQTQAHDHVRHYIAGQNVPLLGPLYQSVDRPRTGVTHGVVSEQTVDGFVLVDRAGAAVTVTITDATRRHPNETFSVGTSVRVIGTVVDGQIDAIGVRPAPPRRGVDDTRSR